MVDITPIIPADRQVIDTYGPGRFRVSNVLYEGPVLVFPDRTVPWAVTAATELTADSFDAVTGAQPPVELLLLGTGPRMELLRSELRRAIRDRGIIVEAMDIGAACRTYNVLLAEGRRVAAALIPV